MRYKNIAVGTLD